MSALDIVLQRQVPVRPPFGGDSEGADGEAAGRSRADAFSSLLAGQKRPAAGSRDQVGSQAGEKADAAEPETGTDEDLPEADGTAGADEMLALLSNLRSGKTADADADAGSGGSDEDGVADPVVAEAAGDATEEATEARPEAVSHKEQIAPEQDKQAALKVDKPDRMPGEDQGGDAVQADSAREPVPAAQASTAAAAATAQAAAGQTAQAAPARTAPSAAASAPRAETSPRARTQVAEPAQAKDKATAEDKEALRTLGAAREPDTGARAASSADTRTEGGAGRRTAGAPDEVSFSKAGQQVDVIESRRFMPAQAMGPNAQMLTRSLAEAAGSAVSTQRAASAQAVDASQPAAGQTLHTLKLQLNPLSLGSVTAVLKLSGEDLTVVLQVETSDAYRQLKDDNQAIVKAMRAQGYSVDSITVQQMSASDRPSGQNAQQQSFQGNHQGAGSNGSGDAQSSSGQRNQGDTSGQQGGRQNGGQVREQGSYTGAGAGRADGVYL